MNPPGVEIELKFLVPAAAREGVRAALAARGEPAATVRLVARYFDTPDRRLARAGMSLRLRREGRRWVQTLKCGAQGSPVRLEHEVPRPDASLDPAVHAGTAAGERLAALLADAQAPLGERYGTDIRRTLRRVRTRGAVVELAFDEGRIVAGPRALAVCELECELVSGDPAALFALARRWRARFGLVLDARSKAERGDALADGRAQAAPRGAAAVALSRKASVGEAWCAVLDECIAQVFANASALAVPAPRGRPRHGPQTAEARAAEVRPLQGQTDKAQQAEALHQLRVGLRRLRCALRLFRGWVAPAPESMADGARELFRRLGALRDADVLAQAIEPALERAGAPPWQSQVCREAALDTPAGAPARRAADLLAGDDAQRFLLDLLEWRVALAGRAPEPEIAGARGSLAAHTPLTPLAPLARARLRRWRQSLLARAEDFAALDDAARHVVRLRAKRLRYALGFLAPVFARKASRRFAKRLGALQEALGELSDLDLARRLYAGQEAGDEPRRWFAAGWLAARREVALQRAQRALAALSCADPFARKD